MKKCPTAKKRQPADPVLTPTQEASIWRARLADEYSIGDPAGELLLNVAMMAFIRLREAQDLIDRDGSIVVDRFGQPRPHPAANLERDSRAGLLAALRALRLDLEPLEPTIGRPPGR